MLVYAMVEKMVDEMELYLVVNSVDRRVLMMVVLRGTLVTMTAV